MILSNFYFITALLAAPFQAKVAIAVSEAAAPACSLNCTLSVLDVGGCPLTEIQACLCTNDTLQYELSLCVLNSCDRADQIVATNILQNEICVGVPYPSRKAYIIRAEIILAAFTFPIIILRLISRLWVARRVWWDDWMVIIAAVFMVPNTAIPIYTAFHGFGVHIWNVRVQDEAMIEQLYYVCQVFYALIQNIAKFSILFLYLRIFPTPRFRLMVKISMAFMACHTIAFTLGVILQCLPIKALWDLTIQGKCLNIHAFALAGAVLSIFEDIFIIILPIGELKGLNLSLQKRTALYLMFALGSFACVTSMIRLKYLHNFYPTIDGSWHSVNVIIWSDIETYTAIICSCLMCIRPLLVKCFPTLFPSSYASSTSNSNPKSNKYLSNTWERKSKGRGSNSTFTLGSEAADHGRGDREGETDEESSIIIQGAGDREKSIGQFELEERGETSSSVGMVEIFGSEDLGFHHEIGSG